jgi:hypothetical protein
MRNGVSIYNPWCPLLKGSRLQGEIYSKSSSKSRIWPCEELGMVLYKDISLTRGGIIYEKLPQRDLVSDTYQEGVG